LIADFRSGWKFIRGTALPSVGSSRFAVYVTIQQKIEASNTLLEHQKDTYHIQAGDVNSMPAARCRHPARFHPGVGLAEWR
jgi:hypothetical protein